jgi:type VI secretion system protein ImpI
VYLTLEIVNAPNLEQLPQRCCTFGIEGGKIGRLPGNEWFIPFDYLHGLHATVRFYNGLFFIEKRGQHRVAVNSPERDLKTDETYPIRDGDRLYLDEIEVSVRVGLERPPAAVPKSPPAPAPAQTPMYLERTGPARQGGLLDCEPKGHSDIDDFLNLGAKAPAIAVTRHEAANQQSILHDSLYLTPETTAPSRLQQQSFQSGPALDDGWYNQPTQYKTPAPPPAPSPAPQPRPAPPPNYPISNNPPFRTPPVEPPSEARYPENRHSESPVGSTGDLTALLSSLGLNPRDLAVGEAELLGRTLRTAITGVVSALQVRAEMRSRFRVAISDGRRAEETLLESSANVDDALHRFFRQRAAGAPALDAAVGSALQEIKCHEFALLDALRVAFDRLLDQFDPQAIQEQMDNATSRASRSMLSGKSRHWEAYMELYEGIAADRENSFRRIYAPAFAEAYQKALEKHQTAARAKRRP